MLTPLGCLVIDASPCSQVGIHQDFSGDDASEALQARARKHEYAIRADAFDACLTALLRQAMESDRSCFGFVIDGCRSKSQVGQPAVSQFGMSTVNQAPVLTHALPLNAGAGPICL